MLRKPDEDLFESSKMSFGEHLDELRTVLIRALLALSIGVAIGFGFANYVVQTINAPLTRGLEQYRAKQALREFDRYADRRLREGNPLSDEMIANAQQQAKEGLIPRVLWLNPDEIAERMKEAGVDVVLPDPTPPGAKAEEGADTKANEGAGGSADGAGGEADDTEMIPLTFFFPLSQDPRTRAFGASVTDGFSVYVKAALLAGVVFSSPAVFYYLWSFVASGLYANERRHVYIFAPFSLALFLLGASVAFFLALGYVLDTLFWFNALLNIDPMPQIGKWLNFALLLPLGFGVGFQLPLVMLFLERIGIFSADQYLKSWRYGVLVIAVASMLLTPSDWQSMVLLAVPMTLLYFGGIALCRYMPRRESPFDQPEPTS
ncbi:MAG: twin-arginine translocase subunit TatC [Planctomycetota bacterium]